MHTTAKIAFLLYDSRSGSTFLSSQLEKFPDIGITIESNFISTLLSAKSQIANNRSIYNIFDIFLRNERFCNLDVSRDEIFFHLQKYTSYNIENITRSLLAAYFSKVKPDSRVWIVKDGSNGYLINQIAQEIPDAKFIHLIRDGRAVFNSRLQTIRPYVQKQRMARDPLTAARVWTSLVNSVDAYMSTHPERCLKIRYEDLINDVEEQMALVRDFFEIGPGERSDSCTNYYDRIPAKEKTIHTLVNHPAVLERVDGWKKELPFEDLILFQFFSGYCLKKHGYIVDNDTSIFVLFSNKNVLLKFLNSCLKRFYGWILLLVDPNRLKKLINIKMLRQRDRRISGYYKGSYHK